MSFEAGVVILTALAFDYVNGFHDAANSIATVVSTRVLSPRFAVAWAAFWNFVAFAVFGTAVAKTVGSGIIDISQVNTQADGFNLLLAALIGAIAYDLITWYFGLPTSSSHALAGGLVGAALAYQGPSMMVSSGVTKIGVFIIISPLVGLIIATILINLSMVVGKRYVRPEKPGRLARSNTVFRRMQLISAAAYSLGHGANDAQKTMGVIAAVLLIDSGHSATGSLEITLPIVLSAHAAIALGTLSGGWRIVHTLGSKITKLQPMGGFAAESGAAITLFGTASLGIPVSTTHTITGAIIGVGATNRFSAVRWGLTGRVIYAWILTIPGSALIAAVSYQVLTVIPADVVAPAGMLAAASLAILFLARRRREEEEAVFSPP